MTTPRPPYALIFGNAIRLLNDASLLVDNHRYASAFALAVLGVEEIGKALLNVWEAEEPLTKTKAWQSPHIRKQTAVSSLLVGALAVRTFPQDAAMDFANLDFNGLTKVFNESAEGQLFQVIQNGELDKRKQNALYQDDWITSVEDDFAELHVNSIIKIAGAAWDALDDSFTRRVGRAFYEITLV
jgi:AbiV family abortive infection protein